MRESKQHKKRWTREPIVNFPIAAMNVQPGCILWYTCYRTRQNRTVDKLEQAAVNNPGDCFLIIISIHLQFIEPTGGIKNLLQVRDKLRENKKARLAFSRRLCGTCIVPVFDRAQEVVVCSSSAGSPQRSVLMHTATHFTRQPADLSRKIMSVPKDILDYWLSSELSVRAECEFCASKAAEPTMTPRNNPPSNSQCKSSAVKRSKQPLTLRIL